MPTRTVRAEPEAARARTSSARRSKKIRAQARGARGGHPLAPVVPPQKPAARTRGGRVPPVRRYRRTRGGGTGARALASGEARGSAWLASMPSFRRPCRRRCRCALGARTRGGLEQRGEEPLDEPPDVDDVPPRRAPGSCCPGSRAWWRRATPERPGVTPRQSTNATRPRGARWSSPSADDLDPATPSFSHCCSTCDTIAATTASYPSSDSMRCTERRSTRRTPGVRAPPGINTTPPRRAARRGRNAYVSRHRTLRRIAADALLGSLLYCSRNAHCCASVRRDATPRFSSSRFEASASATRQRPRGGHRSSAPNSRPVNTPNSEEGVHTSAVRGGARGVPYVSRHSPGDARQRPDDFCSKQPRAPPLAPPPFSWDPWDNDFDPDPVRPDADDPRERFRATPRD